MPLAGSPASSDEVAVEFSETTRAFRLSKLDGYLHDYTTWLTDVAHVIDARHITAREVANQIAKLAS